MNKKIVVGLYGIYGVYNFGCEAIIRGAYSFIKETTPNCEIVYYSYNYEYDKKALSDLNIKIEKVIIKNGFLKKAINKILSLLKTNMRLLTFDYKSIIKKVDVFYSIGGDIYTIPSFIRNNKKYTYYNSLVHFYNFALRKGKKVILYGASVGPWGDYKKAINYYANSLKKYTFILCREFESLNYLKSLGFTNCCFAPDPAFQIKTDSSSAFNERRYIGINFSPLSFSEVFGNSNESIDALANLLDNLFLRFETELLFLPHVFSKNIEDNDLVFLKAIKDRMKYSIHVKVADCSGFLGIKKQIQQCKLVVSARMHCAINAVVECVPAIFVSYSQKSFGMCNYVYGNDKYVISLNEIGNKLLDCVESVLNQNYEIYRF